MKVRPGQLPYWVGGGNLVFCIVCFAAPALSRSALPFALAQILLLVPALVFEYRDLRRRGAQLKVKPLLPDTAGRGMPFEYALEIANGSVCAAQIEYRAELPLDCEPPFWSGRLQVRPEGFVAVVVPMRIGTRGRHGFGPIWLRLRGRLRLLEMQAAREHRREVNVLPEVLIEKEGWSHKRGDQVFLSKLVRTHLQGSGTEFKSLSEYRQSDDPRRIDWRASARMLQLVARRYQIEQHRDTIILLDSGRLMGTDVGGATKLDLAINAALMLGRVALMRGDRFGAGVFDSSVRGYLPPQGDMRSFHRVREAVADIPVRMAETNFADMFELVQLRQHKRAMIIVISDMIDAETTQRFRQALAALRKRHVVLFAAMQNPQFQSDLNAPVRDLREGARAAVMLRLLREREKALFLLGKSGVHVLDLEPRQLTVALVQRYIDLREQNSM